MRQNLIICTTAILLSCGSTLTSYGQKSSIDYNLEEYTVPDLIRHQLDLGFNLYGYSNTYKNELNSVQTENNNKQFITSVNSNYRFYLNTKKWQMNSDVSFLPLSINYTKEIPEDSTITNLSSNISVIYSSNQRFYFNNKVFLEADLKGTLNRYNNTEKVEKDTGDFKRTNSNYDNSLAIPILMGWGRIERVEDARQAVYILDDLKKYNRLAKEPSHDEITEFAQFIAGLKNKRMFDSREKKIWELQQIDSFLVANNFTEQPDMVTFSRINDNWDNAMYPVREAGIRVAAGVRPEIYSQNSDIDNSLYNGNSNSSSNRVSIDPMVDFIYQKPLNLYWQLSVTNNFSLGKTFSKWENNTENYNYTSEKQSWIANNRFTFRIGYYPNTRTSISLFSIYTYSKKLEKAMDEPSDSDEYTNSFSAINTGLLMHYYVSPQVRFTLNPSYSYHNNKFSEELPADNYNASDSRNNFSLTASLSYQIL